MPDDSTLSSDWDERTGSCVCCARRDPHSPPVCDLCRQRLAQALWELRDLHALLPHALAPGQGEKQRVSGSREAPPPLREPALDLIGRTATYGFRDSVQDYRGDQTGTLPVATVLDSWARDWQTYIEADGGDAELPDPAVPSLVSWLSRHLQWALNHHQAIDEFNREVIVLLYTVRSLLNVSRAPTYLPDACPSCGLASLKREAVYQVSVGVNDAPRSAGGDVVCGNCRRTWTYDEFERLAVVLADGEAP